MKNFDSNDKNVFASFLRDNKSEIRDFFELNFAQLIGFINDLIVFNQYENTEKKLLHQFMIQVNIFSEKLGQKFELELIERNLLLSPLSKPESYVTHGEARHDDESSSEASSCSLNKHEISIKSDDSNLNNNSIRTQNEAFLSEISREPQTLDKSEEASSFEDLHDYEMIISDESFKEEALEDRMLSEIFSKSIFFI
jgi:hypothetical protein